MCVVDKSEKFDWLVRTGYFSRALLYGVLGLIALTSAGKIAEGTDGIFLAIEDFPAGTVLLWIMVIGLAAYALFRFSSTFFDIENNGSDTKGWGKRIGHAGSAIGHLALAYSAFKYASSDRSSGGGSDGAEQAAAGILSAELGGLVLGVLGIAFALAAINQFKKAYTGDFMNRISAQAPNSTRLLGGVGFAARGVVYAIIAWSLIKAGFLSSGAEQVKTLGSAVASLAGEGLLFTLVAIGLLMFGIFSLVLARYRIIPDLSSDGRVPSFRA
ncbi:MAG: DUF1206 domain-containing protein [Erythrobacter sp.]|nr:DUF1206 domain-containing protein [Erythrobacter sp.]